MPSELDTKLQCHLQDLQTVVLQELRRLGPELEHWGLMGNLTQKYHHALVSHMNKLLPQTCTTGACLQLLRWALTKYLSPDLFFHPDLNQNQTRDLDLVLLSDWVQEAQERLMHLLEMEVERQLQMTLHNDLEPCESEEDYSSTYMDVIQRIEAAPSVAQTFSSSLSLKLSHLCLRLLHSFTKRYKTQWFEILSKTKWSELELVTFLKCLKTCKEIKKHVQTKYNREQSVKETVLLLEEIETFTVEILLKDLTIFTERALEKYFRSNPTNKILITELERFFRVEPWLCLKEHEAVMSQCYGLIVSLYIKHMTCLTLHKLRRRWSPNMDASVTDDAQLIHELIHNLCPGVKVWNISLHFVSDVLKTEDIDSIKISTGDLLQKCKENGLTLDTSLLTGLLQWKGLSRSRIREVLDSLTDLDSDLDSPLPSRCCIG
ncbi:hypothetical protein NQD34_018513 [Periophthalmus magnuspinnatus]|nr:hypothetical protein NQD34_018513 [Periophthalmus magnuspinnatus]